MLILSLSDRPSFLLNLAANQSGAAGMGFGRSLLTSVNENPLNTNVLAAIDIPNPLQ